MQGLEPVVSVVGMKKGAISGMELSDEFEFAEQDHHHLNINPDLIRDVVTAPF